MANCSVIKCKHKHEFPIFDDHPKTNDSYDCPHCMKIMVIQFESYMKLVEEKEQSMTRKGFTIVELLVALIFIGAIISGIYTLGYKFFSMSNHEGTVVSCQFLGQTFNAQQGSTFSANGTNFAVDLKTEKENIIFSSVDRKFGIIKAGDRIRVRVQKYPPWDFDHANEYYNGRVTKKF